MKSTVLIVAFYLITLPTFANDFSNEGMAKFIGEYSTWATEVDKKAKTKGELLTKSEIALAKEIEVSSPEKVRIVKVDSIPFPYENVFLKK